MPVNFLEQKKRNKVMTIAVAIVGLIVAFVVWNEFLSDKFSPPSGMPLLTDLSSPYTGAEKLKIDFGPLDSPHPTGVINDSTPLLSVSTNEKAVCKFDRTNVSYTAMGNTFEADSSGKSHEFTSSFLEDGKYVFYVKCKDESGAVNEDTVFISFTVSTDETPSEMSSPSPLGEISDKTPLLSVTTNEQAVCRFDTEDIKYSSMKNEFSTAGGKIHTAVVGPLGEGDHVYYAKCKDRFNIINDDPIEIAFTVSAPPAVEMSALDEIRIFEKIPSFEGRAGRENPFVPTF